MALALRMRGDAYCRLSGLTSIEFITINDLYTCAIFIINLDNNHDFMTNTERCECVCAPAYAECFRVLSSNEFVFVCVY